MKTLNSTHKKTPSRKRSIIEAALSCFSEFGYNESGISDICGRASVSTGSLYHHFGSKERLAAEVYLEGIRDYQRGYTAVLEKTREPRAGIHAVIDYHIGWVVENRNWARYLFHMRHAEFMDSIAQEFAALNAAFYELVGAWFRRHVQSGAFRRLAPDLFASVLMGPCQEYTRMVISGRASTPPDTAVREITASVWRALRGD